MQTFNILEWMDGFLEGANSNMRWDWPLDNNAGDSWVDIHRCDRREQFCLTDIGWEVTLFEFDTGAPGKSTLVANV
jgi:hypothetical protein